LALGSEVRLESIRGEWRAEVDRPFFFRSKLKKEWWKARAHRCAQVHAVPFQLRTSV
jgi:hypothetical protein